MTAERAASSLIKGGTVTVTATDDNGGRSLALVGVGLRHSRRRLKRAAPTDARGRCPQKLNFVSLVKRETTITVPINQPLALVGGASLTVNGGGSIGVRSLALVGEAFRLLRCRLKRAMPTDACRRCRQKLNFVSLVKRETTITVSR
ncbi:MAG: hypothetical protein MPK62_05185 [Alphaproteobacteria bacterium]|nr:hypothetical protein [Alphaproteobacteria bacterium]